MGQGQNTGPQDRSGVENKVPTGKEEWEKGVVAVAMVVTLTLVANICRCRVLEDYQRALASLTNAP